MGTPRLKCFHLFGESVWQSPSGKRVTQSVTVGLGCTEPTDSSEQSEREKHDRTWGVMMLVALLLSWLCSPTHRCCFQALV
ncbi:hypothetical protein GBA52_025525 [Prunus armeniaca]|nr:hypothetical protein GBA52_025525 [Prunus armeniaca]